MNTVAKYLVIFLLMPVSAAFAETSTNKPTEEESVRDAADALHQELDGEDEIKAQAVEAVEEAPIAQPTAEAAPAVQELQAAPVGANAPLATVSDDLPGEETTLVAPADSKAPRKKPSISADDDSNAVAAAMGLDVPDGDDKLPIGMMLVLSHNVSAGYFVQSPEVRSRTGILAQTWDIRPFYNFQAFGKKLVLQGRVFFNVFLNEPNTNPANRFEYNDSWITLLAPSLYNDPYTGININAGLRYVIPTGRGTWSVRRQAGAVTAFVGARRSFGPVTLQHMVFGGKNINTSRVSAIPSSNIRDTDIALLPSDTTEMGGRVLGDYAAISHSISNWSMISYAVTPQLFLTYSVFVWNAFGYGMGVADNDPNTSPFADNGIGRLDVLSPSIDVTYALGSALKGIIDLPFNLLASLGVSSTHPAQHHDNSGIQLPFIFNTFGRSAGFAFDGSVYAGNVYFTLMGTY